MVADEGGAHLVLPDRGQDAAERRVHQPPEDDHDDREDAEAEIEQRLVAAQVDAGEAEVGSTGRAMLSRPSSPPVTLCHLTATNQNTWPKAIVSSAK